MIVITWTVLVGFDNSDDDGSDNADDSYASVVSDEADW